MQKLFSYSYSPPSLVKNIFYDYQWNTNSNKILLTFDDGPNPGTTEIILEELEKLSIKAVFFCVGENLEKYPKLAAEILRNGHEIGNHTHQHKKLTKLSKNEIVESINTVQDLALRNFNYKIKYFRPPHGRFTLSTSKILREKSLINVMWSLLTYDYKNDLNIVKFATSRYLSNNSIIVLHDSMKSKDIIIDAIKLIVEQANQNNFLIGKPSECLKLYS